MADNAIIENPPLPDLLNLLTQNNPRNIRKEACRTISYYMARSEDAIQAVIEAGIIAQLVHLLQNDVHEFKKESARAISYAIYRGTHEQINFLVREGCIKPLCDLLICPDPTVVSVCLECLENILKVGEADKSQGISGGVNVFAQMIDEAEGLEKIEYLVNHGNQKISGKAVKILDTYWLEEEEDEQLISGGTLESWFPLGGAAVPQGGFSFKFD